MLMGRLPGQPGSGPLRDKGQTVSESPAEPKPRRRLRRRAVLLPAGVVLVILLGLALAAFEPWTLVTDETVDEALPTVSTRASPEPSTSASAPAGSPSPQPSEPPVEPIVLARGSFISHEHATAGDVRVLELADGSRVLRIEGLDTSNGPDLHVWITDAAVLEGRDGWFVFDDGAYVDLGALKGNQGNQNYALPDDLDLSELTSVSIWCQRFRVSFGAAELALQEA